MIIYCLDTANLEMIKKAKDKYPVGAFSMNPSIAVRDLNKSKKGFLENVKEMRNVIGTEVEFYLQVIGETAEDMIKDAETIVKSVPGNTIIKIPACPEGIKAIRLLKKSGIKAGATGVLDVNQAVLASMAGAVNVAVYLNRLDNVGGDGIEVIRKIYDAFKIQNIKCHISAASIKNALYVEKSILAGADYITVSYELLEQLATHSLTAKTLAGFKSDWEGLYGEEKMIYNL